MVTKKPRGKVGRPSKKDTATSSGSSSEVEAYVPSMFTHRRVTVTPSLALEWLDTMVINRKVLNTRVQQYARDMYKGNWKDNGDTIKFDDENHLRDGQNRLWAVVEANTPITFEVLWGISPESQKYIDIGASRKPADSLFMEGVSYSNKLSTPLSLLSQYDNGNRIALRGQGTRLNTFEVVDTLALYPNIEESAKFIFSTAVLQKLMTGSHLVFCHFIFNRIDVEACSTFWERVDQGINLTKSDPVFLLREKFIANKTAAPANKTDPVTMIALVIKAWNFYRRSRNTSRLVFNPNKESFPHAV